ncbi:hypothetical protein CCMA1212_007819 [Trichoderma ghanense]|uniref:DUF4238 domain-containing protein n=1 Tax=Trichoderma ghanense TaxID=65468 RepID=A0ABY2GWY7_9HYPO
METRKPEYQHFIPQFLLRNFSHKYVPPDGAKAGKPKKRTKKNRMYPGDDVINSLCLSDEYHIDECLVRRVCGMENMYVDKTKPAKEQGNLEKKFGVLENRASCVYREVIKAYEDGESHIWLKREDEDILRKFIFLLAYRGEQYRKKYNFDSIQDYDEDDKDSLQAYMTKHGFTRPISVWLHGLETIIDLNMDTRGRWKARISESVYSNIAKTFVSHIEGMYMAICTPANPDEEFVLTDNCYNVGEGPATPYYDESVGNRIIMWPRFHRFAPISPRLLLVLRRNILPEPNENIDSLYGSAPKSILEDLPIRKATANYRNFAQGTHVIWDNSDRSWPLAMDDYFCFTIFKLPTRHVRIMNGLLIDDAFHGSRIVFNRKDAFIDLMEWYLTELCEVGKSLKGEHAAAQLAYLKGLSQFMLRAGRAVVAERAFWPSKHRDLKQFHTQNVAGARFLEEVMRGENDANVGFDAIYERLGGTKEAFDEDMRMSSTMFEIWGRCVDLDWGSPDYEHLRSNKLDWLLDGFLRRQSCVRFWMFLKHMRLAQSGGTQIWAAEAIHDISFFENCCNGPEDRLAYSFSVTNDRELNEAMYKSFNKTMDLINGPGRGLESMGHFSLFGDPSWRIPTPGPIERWPWNRGRADDGPDLGEAQLVSLAIDLNRKASTNCDGRNQHSDEPEMEDVDTSGLKKAARSRLSHHIATETPTKAVEELQPDDEETQEVPDALKRAARSWFLDKEDNETPTNKFEEPQPANDKGAPEVSDADEKVPPEQPQNETHRNPRPWYSALLMIREAYGSLDTDMRISILGQFAFAIMVLSLTLFVLAWGSFLLSHLIYFAVWILRGLAWWLGACFPVFRTLATYLYWVGLVLFWLLWKIEPSKRAA